MIKKMILLALAVGALSALPSAAMALEWTDGTIKVGTERQLQTKGNAKFSSGVAGSVDCKTTSTLKLIPGTTGEITSFHPDTGLGTITQVCKAGGALANCQVHAVQATNLPWVGHIVTETVQSPKHEHLQKLLVTSGAIHNTLGGQFCPAASLEVTPSNEVTVLLDNEHGATNLTLDGSVQVDSSLGKLATTVSGTQTIQGSDATTYGIT